MSRVTGMLSRRLRPQAVKDPRQTVSVTLVAGDRQRFAAQGELHLQQVPGAVAQELQFPAVREGGGAEVA
ncbi:hypothetical protein ACX122_01465 [Kosakonia cowanii]